MKVLPFLPSLLSRSLNRLLSRPLLSRPCRCGVRVSSALLRATLLEPVVLTGQALLLAAGIIGERRHPRGLSGPAPAPSTSARTIQAPAAPAAPDSVGDPQSGEDLRHGEPPPVVLLRGSIDNRSVFVPLRRALARHGRRHLESLNHASSTCDIRTAAELLGRHVEEICARTGHSEVDIVGHGLGGLVARYYVQRLGGDQRVRILVTLGTPHGGTSVAPPAGAHPLVRQMQEGSGPIEELRRPAPGCRTRFVSFWSERDRVVVPAEAACVDHPDLDAMNVRVSGVGHLALPVHPAVVAAVRQALETREPAVDTSGGALLPGTSDTPGAPERTTETTRPTRTSSAA